MIKGFEFEHEERTYHCTVEPLRAHGGGDAWWWFNVSGDPNRYAPFHAAGSDTRERDLIFKSLSGGAGPPQRAPELSVPKIVCICRN